ncbi:O-antigen polymerase [Tropicimonas sp. TH_r6]|uniref:O-antigen polymerase n=1 Tax=Tropicimonas sp. TH_r6 TaxID=3082085 RepID=UPI0029540810|nr:O-antigen polymerase [Tropicimonas sp. TH_r6]MDV7144305.1 O-antigen polymerase [Tropicimonas sp. TH_r6]
MSPFVETGRAMRLVFAAAIAFCALAALIAGFAAGQQQYLVGLGFLVYAGIAIVPFLLRDPTVGWFHPLMFMVLWWGIVRYILPLLPVLMFGFEEHYAIFGASDAELNAIAGKGFLLSALGLAAFYLGFLTVRPISLPLPTFAAPALPALKTAIILGISLVALTVLARELGGLDRLLLQRGLARDNWVDVDLGGRHWHFLAGLGVNACLVWLAFAPDKWRSPDFIVMFLLSLVISFATTGSRSVLLVPIIMAGAIWCLDRRRFPYLATASFLFLGLFVVGIGGQFREISRGASSVNIEDLDTSIGGQVVRGAENIFRYGTEFDGFLAILANVPDKMPLLYGESYLSVAFVAIPSVLLPFEKPEAGGRIVSERLFDIPNSGVPPGNIGEAYMNLHVPGVVLVMFAFGAVMKSFAHRFASNSTKPFDRLFYVATLFLLQPNSTAIYDWVQSGVVLVFFTLIYCGLPLGVSRGSGVSGARR